MYFFLILFEFGDVNLLRSVFVKGLHDVLVVVLVAGLLRIWTREMRLSANLAESICLAQGIVLCQAIE